MPVLLGRLSIGDLFRFGFAAVLGFWRGGLLLGFGFLFLGFLSRLLGLGLWFRFLILSYGRRFFSLHLGQLFGELFLADDHFQPVSDRLDLGFQVSDDRILIRGLRFDPLSTRKMPSWAASSLLNAMPRGAFGS